MRKTKKLSLNKEILKDLNESDIQGLAGGIRTNTCPRYCTEDGCSRTCFETECFCWTRRPCPI